jgi:hypothetical protein
MTAGLAATASDSRPAVSICETESSVVPLVRNVEGMAKRLSAPITTDPHLTVPQNKVAV